ncbi:hypothetical protein GGTG_01937 [Gaeumannomyces tritici R3-111a-1]|uniref:NTF2 and RRM domain-containing protein n=1 Tax=Gaeumannomyces tritici (strain R3-111a-1) TaxID=644352 RepID=J3NKZ6_GAET3|nr:hypothetical protein GGTG_01937 [Gaeumannomyces tritici R3-111a-1]EJT81963.1 hypothetical protein GGTG_01937 [Gaeumannomyces tritici R3-111a-1]
MATMPTNGSVNHQEHPAGNAAGSDNSNLSKDEVGWYFVEQYYLTLSKNPEKLHLFYGKQSQFVYGLEAEVANVSVGRQQIQERIKSLDLQDCKVRVSNVDSQASGDSIVIQVIGETVNKGGEPKKFVQTFILAKQPSGYFVLNDILRYINDDAEDETPEVADAAEEAEPVAPEAEAAPVEAEAPKSEPVEETAAPAQVDTAAVSKKLEEISDESNETPTTSAIATPAEPAAPAEEPAAAAPAKTETVAEAAPDPETVAQEVAEEESKKVETPKDPTPTPALARAPVPAEPEKPKEPAKPMTWASRIAAAAGPARPAVALPKPATPVATPAPRPAAAPAAAPTPAAPQPAAAPAAAAPEAAKDSGEWQTAGSDSKRQNRPVSVTGAPQEKEGTLGYVKYVTEKVKAETLKSTLTAFGDLVYFDINRTKNCAFVEFATPAGYQAAAAANPHTVDGENIIVEARRPKASAYGGSNYNSRGGIPGRGRGNYEGGRSGGQGGRGGFNNQPRGGRGGGAPRGRGVSQPANA